MTALKAPTIVTTVITTLKLTVYSLGKAWAGSDRFVCLLQIYFFPCPSTIAPCRTLPGTFLASVRQLSPEAHVSTAERSRLGLGLTLCTYSGSGVGVPGRITA